GQRSRVDDQIEPANELETGSAERAAVRVGVAPPLMIVTLDRVGLDARSDVGEGLFGPAAIGRREGPRLALGVVARLGERQALHLTGDLIGGQQMSDLLLERNRERIFLDGGLVGS